MFKTDSESQFKAIFVSKQEQLWSRMGERAFITFFSNNMFTEVYNFTAASQVARPPQENQDVQKIANEIKELIQLGWDKFNLDIRNDLRKALFPYILNAFVIRLSGLVATDKTFAAKMRERFLKDFDYLVEYLNPESTRGKEDEGPAKAFSRFRQLYFVEPAFPDDKKDKLRHFVYKLRFKKKSFTELVKF